MELLNKKNNFLDPISKEYVPYKNLIIIQNSDNTTFLFYDIFSLLDWIISSNSLINPIHNTKFTKKQLKCIINNLYDKKIINFKQKNILIKNLKDKYFKEIFILTLSQNITNKNNEFHINYKLKQFLINNQNIHNKILKKLNNNILYILLEKNNVENNVSNSLLSLLYYLYNQFNLNI